MNGRSAGRSIALLGLLLVWAVFHGVPAWSQNEDILQGGKVDPATGTTNTQFTYSILYTYSLDLPPLSATLIIDQQTQLNLEPTGSDWSSGVIFQRKLSLPAGDHTFRFAFAVGGPPGSMMPVRLVLFPGPGEGDVLNGPSVSGPGGDLLRDGKVSPTTGTTDTLFTYSIVYMGMIPPAPAVVIIDQKIAARLVSPTANPGGAGAYMARLRLPAGDHVFRFLFVVGGPPGTMIASRLLLYPGPTQDDVLTGPSVSGSGGDLLRDGKVDPTTGTTDTLFTYSIFYTGTVPPASAVVIIDQKTTARLVSPAANPGPAGIYLARLKLPAGDHVFRFAFAVGFPPGPPGAATPPHTQLVLYPGPTQDDVLKGPSVTTAGLSISGIVRTAASRSLEGVNVTVVGGGAVAGSATTGADGRFKIDGLAPGAYTVLAEKKGFRLLPRSYPVRVPPSRSDIFFVAASNQ